MFPLSGISTRFTDVIYLDSCKAFDTVPQETLVSKLERHGFDRWITRWIRNWLDSCTQRLVVSSLTSKWRPVMSGIPRGQYQERHCLTSLSATRIVGLGAPSASLLMPPSCVVQLTHWREGMPSRGTLTGWSSGNIMKLNKAKCKVLHMGWGNPKHKHRLGREWTESSPEEKDFRVVVHEKLNMTRQYALTAQKANCILGCIKRSMASKVR